MTSLSDDFKQRMLAPIEDLFREALDGSGPPLPASGGRNWAVPDTFMGSGSGAPMKRKPVRDKSKQTGVDEKALRAAMQELLIRQENTSFLWLSVHTWESWIEEVVALMYWKS